MQQSFFIADLIACSTCFGHHYAHHQELSASVLQSYLHANMLLFFGKFIFKKIS